MKPYPTYKDSGQPWLGTIPEHWETRRLKHTLSRNDNGVWGLDLPEGQVGTIVLRSTEQTVDGEWKIEEPAQRLLTKVEVAATKLIAGDMLITKSSGSELHIGKTSIVTEEIALMGCCFSNFMQRLRVKPNANPRFVRYVINGSLGRAQFVFNSNSTIGLANLNSDVIGNVFTAIPPAAEQAAIVTFLDRKTFDIERFITKKRQLIALLNEQKAALINQAVTKGLNPDVPMKDSGVEWLGEVPAHWEVRRLRFLAGKINSGVTPAGGATVYQEMGVPFLRSQNVHFDGLRLDDVAHIPESIHQEMAGSAVKPNDVLLNITGASIGRCCCVPEDFGEANVNQHVCIIRTTKVEPRFLANFLSSAPIQRQIRTDQNGASREGLNYGQIKEFFIALPPETEQASLISYIEAENAIIGKAINRIEREIELIQDYRTTLISDAVTGKIDVREAESLTT